jgi:S1-C subfamily serine protease
MVSVDPTGTAADSGIQKGNIIIGVQQTRVSQPDQASRLFEAQSATKHRFAAVLVERGKTRTWIPIAVPE